MIAGDGRVGGFARGRSPLARPGIGATLFLGLVTGEVGYRECLLKALTALPAWLVAPRVPVAPIETIAASA